MTPEHHEGPPPPVGSGHAGPPAPPYPPARPYPPFTQQYAQPHPPPPYPPAHPPPAAEPDPPPAAGPVARPRRRLAWPGVLALVLVLALAGGLGYQSWQLDRFAGQLAELNRRQAQEQAADREQLDALAERAADLEQQAGAEFDPEAIAEAVLPSVFRVEAGAFSGTAFAVGDGGDGGSDLLTNYHVVESLWLVGGREVVLERTGERHAATILEVDPAVDLAWLFVEEPLPSLQPASDEVRAGQPIIAVGAPLGLADTVTTGVVSTAERELDGSGTHIQFDASVNPGNSGGPVINSAKEVVGITTLKAGDAEGIGFAVPMAVACDTFDVC